MNNYIEDDKGNKSSMRLLFMACILMDIIFILLLASDMIITMIRGMSQDWNGIAAYLGSIALFTSGAALTKAWQKKFENN